MVYGGMIKFAPMCFRMEKHRVKAPSWGATSAALLSAFAAHLGQVPS